MFLKKLLPLVLFVTATANVQAESVFDNVAENSNFEDFSLFLDENQGDVALESSYVSITIDLLKLEDTSAAAWMHLIACLSEVMRSADNQELVIQQVTDFIRSPEFKEVHGEIGVYIGQEELNNAVDGSIETVK